MALILTGASGSTTLDSSAGLTFSDSSNQAAAASPYVLKNRIINGAMVISQRNGTSTISIDNTERFVVDRFLIRSNASGLSATSQQSTTVPNNFVNSMIVSVTTGGTIAAATRGYIQQRIEGFNVSDFGWGSSAALTVTLSFWVRSSKTGTFSGALQNDPALGNRSYVFTYSISSANTWEQKTVTIVGDTTGTWYKDNSTGINLMFDLGNGSDLRTATTGSWVAGDYRGANSSVNIFDTSGATFYITGVQLEQNTTATPFERRLYGQELANCQRYYAKMTTSGFGAFATGFFGSATAGQMSVKYPVSMRANPTASLSSCVANDSINAISVTGIGAIYAGIDSCRLDISFASGGTQHRPFTFQGNNSGNSFVDFSAEL
jgi:hypothetical protein